MGHPSATCGTQLFPISALIFPASLSSPALPLCSDVPSAHLPLGCPSLVDTRKYHPPPCLLPSSVSYPVPMCGPPPRGPLSFLHLIDHSPQFRSSPPPPPASTQPDSPASFLLTYTPLCTLIPTHSQPTCPCCLLPPSQPLSEVCPHPFSCPRNLTLSRSVTFTGPSPY